MDDDCGGGGGDDDDDNKIMIMIAILMPMMIWRYIGNRIKIVCSLGGTLEGLLGGVMRYGFEKVCFKAITVL